jgi:hypothetical protein
MGWGRQSLPDSETPHIRTPGGPAGGRDLAWADAVAPGGLLSRLMNV